MTPAPDTHPELASLARRLAPGVMDIAVTEARERARRQIVERLADEIVAVAFRESGLPDSGIPAGEAEPPPGYTPPESAPTECTQRSPAAAPADSAPREVTGPPVARHQGTYAYGVLAADVDTAGLTGVGGTELCSIARGPIALAVSTIDLGLLEGVEDDLSEAGPLAILARQHDDAVRGLPDRDAVLPLRFGTVLPSEDDALDLLDDPRGELREGLRGLRGKREWGFRVDVTDDGAGSATDEPDDGLDERADRTVAAMSRSPDSGTAYLTGQRQARRAATRRRERWESAAARADQVLSAYADDVAPRRRGANGRIFDSAYLIPVAGEEEFLEAVRRMSAEIESVGCSATVTGPWPAYSFVHLTLGGDGGEGNG